MAALNQMETQALRDAQSAFDLILRHGYNPDTAESDPAMASMKEIIKLAKSKVNMVTQMKGYYAK